MMFLLLVLTLLQQFHFLLDFLSHMIIYLASRYAIHYILLLVINNIRLFYDRLWYFSDGLFSLLLLSFIHQHWLQFLQLIQVRNQDLYKLKLKLLLDKFIRYIWTIDQLNKQLLKLFTRLKILDYIIMPLPENLILDHFYFIFMLPILLQLEILTDVF